MHTAVAFWSLLTVWNPLDCFVMHVEGWLRAMSTRSSMPFCSWGNTSSFTSSLVIKPDNQPGDVGDGGVDLFSIVSDKKTASGTVLTCYVARLILVLFLCSFCCFMPQSNERCSPRGAGGAFTVTFAAVYRRPSRSPFSWNLCLPLYTHRNVEGASSGLICLKSFSPISLPGSL